MSVSINQRKQFNIEVELTDIANHSQEASSKICFKRFNFVPLRLSRFFLLAYADYNISLFNSALNSVLAMRSCLFVISPPCSEHFSSSQHPTMLLKCAFCDFSIQLADISALNPHSEVYFTAKLLTQFGPEHAANCEGHNGFLNFNEDDAHFSLPENQSLSSTSFNSPTGTAILHLSCFYL